jgi:hypothetical protein
MTDDALPIGLAIVLAAVAMVILAWAFAPGAFDWLFA